MADDIFAEVQHLGSLIRLMRESRGISATELAETTNLSSSVISKFERGQTDIQLSTTIQLLSAIGLTVDDLCKEGVFDGFAMIDWVEKAYRYADDKSVLERTIAELAKRKKLLTHEQVFQDILMLRVGSKETCPESVVDYFEDLELILTFDAYLAILAQPFLPAWLLPHIAKKLNEESGHLTPAMEKAWLQYRSKAS